MNQFVQIDYGGEPETAKIAVDISTVGHTVLVADSNGMAQLASVLTNFLLHAEPHTLRYEIGPDEGLSEGSPKLILEFDDKLDTLGPEPSGDDSMFPA